MAFPVIVAVAVSPSSGGSTINVVIPSGGVGELLLSLIIIDGADTSVEHTAGWEMPAKAGGTQVTSALLWRIATGSDELTVTLPSVSRNKAAITYRISGHGHSVSVPIELAAPSSTSFNDAPAPPPLAPSWGAADTLWVAGFAMDDGSKNLISYPTNFTLSQQVFDSNSTVSVLGALAGRNLNAASEAPGAFTVSAVDQWLSYTIAIKPTGGARPRTPLMLTPW